jgi:hypothetical protein
MFTDKKGCIWGDFAALAIALYVGWSLSWPTREARRWDDCLGRLLTACQIPEGYEGAGEDCPQWFECRTGPLGVRFAYAEMLKINRGALTGSYAYAVLMLDTKGKVLRVEIDRFYPSL